MASSEPARNVSTPPVGRPASLRAGSATAGQIHSEAPRASGSGSVGTRPGAPEQEAAKAWIRAHEELALISAFAVGVFIGTLMRS